MGRLDRIGPKKVHDKDTRPGFAVHPKALPQDQGVWEVVKKGVGEEKVIAPGKLCPRKVAEKEAHPVLESRFCHPCPTVPEHIGACVHAVHLHLGKSKGEAGGDIGGSTAEIEGAALRLAVLREAFNEALVGRLKVSLGVGLGLGLAIHQLWLRHTPHVCSVQLHQASSCSRSALGSLA
jgi:hypothetical protein